MVLWAVRLVLDIQIYTTRLEAHYFRKIHNSRKINKRSFNLVPKITEAEFVCWIYSYIVALSNRGAGCVAVAVWRTHCEGRVATDQDGLTWY